MLDVHAVWTETMGVRWLARAERLGLLRLAQRLPKGRIRTGLALFDTYKWRYGVDTFAGLLQVAEKAVINPVLITFHTNHAGSGSTTGRLIRPGGEGELEDAPAVVVLVGEVAVHELGELAGDTEPDSD